MPDPVYMDCNATTPVDPRVADLVYRFMVEEYGNPGSRTHVYGSRAKKAVDTAREQVAAVVDAHPSEVIFTSGATESNNIAILGLAEHGEITGKKHIVSTQIEHKAVLDPLTHLGKRGFEITLVPPTPGGWIEPDAIMDAVREDTLLVSVMHVNNETGVIQPIDEIANLLNEMEAYFHTDAAQGFGKELASLKCDLIDLISFSGHKLYSPKGIGGLICRKRGFLSPPIKSITYGGGQERGLRPGTLPAHLIVGLGKICELCITEHARWEEHNSRIKKIVADAFTRIDAKLNGEQSRTLNSTLSVCTSNIDSEALMLELKDIACISNGAACSSSNYSSSHVLHAMGFDSNSAERTTRWSWSHLTEYNDVKSIIGQITKCLDIYSN